MDAFRSNDHFKSGIIALGTLLGLAGCSTKTDSMGDPITTPGTAGMSAATSGTGGGAAPGGTAGTGTGTGTAGTTGDVTPVAGMTGSTAGTTGSSAGTGGMSSSNAGEGGGGAGEGAAGEGGSSGGAVCDTSSFLTDCKQGGDQWGTDQQSGPCKSGVTVYGVKQEFGPYGVSSEYNVGADFNTGNTSSDFSICPVFISSFGADPVGSADLMDTHDLDFGLFTVFHPGCMPEGEKFPLITWGNGTCAMPEGYGPLLRYVASHGYIVVAANSVQVGSGAQQRKAIDFMLAENEKEGSKYYQKIDTDKIGAMGHSQGGMGTVAAAADERIKSVILWNGGTSASKPFLAVSGDRDIGGTPSGMANACNAAPRPAAWLWYHQVPQAVNGSTTGTTAPGHLTLMMEPERVQEVAVAWWDMMLKGKAEAKAMFVGPTCTLCDGSAYPSMWSPFVQTAATAIEYGANSMLQ